MDIFLAIAAGLLILAGFAGAFAPVLPGPPLSWLGILLLHFTRFAQFSVAFLVLSAVFMLLITIFDFYIPIWGTKKFGGTRAGVVGSTIGLLIGFFLFPPFGLILGPFVGAFLGEISQNRNDYKTALKSAVGSFLGFVIGTGIKLLYSAVMAVYFVRAFWL